jgi:hypothetical protein
LNFNDIEIYAGFADARLQVDAFHFGHGIALSRTFAHLSAPFLAGFLPRPPRAAGDSSWRPEPRSFDVVAQLHVPEDSSPLRDLDRVNTVWWLAVLLRLKATPRLTVVGLSSEPFGGDPRIWRGAGFWPLEAEPRRIELDPSAAVEVRQEDLEWVRDHWLTGAGLMAERPELRRAVGFFDRSCFAPGTPEALQAVWDSLAALFLPDPQDDGHRLAANLAVFLDVPAGERDPFLRGAGELLDARMASLEGATEGLEEPLGRTYALAKRALVRIFESGYVPTLREMETGHLGPH